MASLVFIRGLEVDNSHVPPIDPPPPGTRSFPVYQGAEPVPSEASAVFSWIVSASPAPPPAPSSVTVPAPSRV